MDKRSGPGKNSKTVRKQHFPDSGLLKTAFLFCVLFVLLFSCENPMINYILGEKEDVSFVAQWNGTWYYSLAEAIDAAADGISASSPSLIQIRRNITRPRAFGGNAIILSAGKHIRLVPYTPDTSSVLIQRWQGGAPLFTVESGASLTLGPLVTVGGTGGNAVHVKNGAPPGTLVMEPGALIHGGLDVYLETGAMITVTGNFTANSTENPIARITPQAYTTGEQVLDGIPATAVTANNRKFDVTTEPAPAGEGWVSPRYWRVDEDGKLYSPAARRFDSGDNTTKYYRSLQQAVNETIGAANNYETVTLIANINMAAADKIIVGTGIYVRLTVPEGNTYFIKRTETTVETMFFIDMSGALELTAPAGTQLILDGGVVWGGTGNPASGAASGFPVNTSGITSARPLVQVEGAMGNNGTFILNSGAVLQNNAMTGDGGAVKTTGRFYMKGGTITRNRASGSGGGILIDSDNGESILSGGLITENDAGQSGGGVLLSLNGESILTMTGGTISGNRAGGKAGGLVSPDPSMRGFGGGVFIPGLTTGGNEFHMAGGTISGNTSINGDGTGNGVAMDCVAYPTPVFTMSGAARIFNNDVLLHNTYPDDGYNRCRITIAGNLNTPADLLPVAVITLDSYPAAVQVLDGLVGGNALKFAAAGAHTINGSGYLLP